MEVILLQLILPNIAVSKDRYSDWNVDVVPLVDTILSLKEYSAVARRAAIVVKYFGVSQLELDSDSTSLSYSLVHS